MFFNWMGSSGTIVALSGLMHPHWEDLLLTAAGQYPKCISYIFFLCLDIVVIEDCF